MSNFFYNKLPIILLSEMVSSKTDSTNGHIAACILANLDEIPSMSTRDLAAKASVSASSVSRFCRDIGLEDFNELKDLIEEAYHGLEICSDADAIEEQKEDYIDAVEEGLDMVRQSVSMSQVRKLCLDIEKYERVAAFGLLKAEGVAMNLQADLAMLGKSVVTKISFAEQMDYLKRADEHDLIIIFSYTGVYFRYGFSLAGEKNKRPRLYFITSDQEAKKSDRYDEVIWFASRQSQITHPYQLQVIAGLIAQCYANQKRAE